MMPPVVLFAIACLFFAFVCFVIDRIIENRKKYRRSLRIDNLYVVELPRGEYLYLPFEKDLVLFAKKGRVEKTASAEMELIRLSGNRRGVEKRVYYFQDGERVNETKEEYAEFVTEQIREDRAKRHANLSKKDRSFYIEHKIGDVIDF